MMRSIGSELKKILKNKVNILLFLILTCWVGYNTYGVYQLKMPTYENTAQQVPLKTFDGKPLTSMKEVITYADEILSNYEGEATMALWKTYSEDYERLYNSFTKDVDTAMMEKVYGKDYKRIFEKANGNMSEEEYYDISEKIQNYNINCGNITKSIDQYDEATKSADFPIFCKKQAELYTLNLIYTNQFISSPKQLITDNPNLYILANKDKNIENNIIEGNYYSYERPDNYIKDTNFNQFISNKIMSEKQYFGSAISMELLKYSLLSSVNFFTLLLVGVVLANSFSIENQTKTDQIIVPCKLGSAKITLSKVIAGLLVALGMTLLQFLCVFVIAFIMMKPEGWDIALISQSGLVFHSNATYMNYKEVIITHIGMVLLGAAAIGITTMSVSCFFKNRFAAVIASFSFILLPLFAEEILPKTIVKLIPTFFTEAHRFFEYDYFSYGSPVVTLFGQTIWWKYIILLVWIGIIVLLTLAMILKAKRHVVSNR